jgi:DeoR/GlpR family transcriptional regulator of sugar metabolism
MTLRRDLISLENDGHLIRTFGGAVNAKRFEGSNGEEDAYSRRAAENVEAKIKIAEKALGLLEKGRSIYFDAGSTLMCLAKLVPDENYSIVTCGANIALELVKKSNVSVVTPGGLLNKNTLSISGPNAVSFMDTINIDIAFMATSGFSFDSGFTVSNIYECELKRKVIKRARKKIILMDKTKINKNLPFTFAGLEDINMLISENVLPKEIADEIGKYNIKLL